MIERYLEKSLMTSQPGLSIGQIVSKQSLTLQLSSVSVHSNLPTWSRLARDIQ